MSTFVGRLQMWKGKVCTSCGGHEFGVDWPAISPDLTPVESLLWGHFKDIVYSVIQNEVDRDLWFKNITTTDTQNPSEAKIKHKIFPAYVKKNETN